MLKRSFNGPKRYRLHEVGFVLHPIVDAVQITSTAHSPSNGALIFRFFRQAAGSLLIKVDCYCIHNRCSASCIINTRFSTIYKLCTPVDVWMEDWANNREEWVGNNKIRFNVTIIQFVLCIHCMLELKIMW